MGECTGVTLSLKRCISPLSACVYILNESNGERVEGAVEVVEGKTHLRNKEDTGDTARNKRGGSLEDTHTGIYVDPREWGIAAPPRGPPSIYDTQPPSSWNWIELVLESNSRE